MSGTVTLFRPIEYTELVYGNEDDKDDGVGCVVSDQLF